MMECFDLTMNVFRHSECDYMICVRLPLVDVEFERQGIDRERVLAIFN